MEAITGFLTSSFPKSLADRLRLWCKISFGNRVLRQKSLYFECHSGLDQPCPVLDTAESNDFNWVPAFAGMTASELI